MSEAPRLRDRDEQRTREERPNDERETPQLFAGQPPVSYAGRTRYTQLEYEAILANASIGIAFTRDRRFFLCNPKFAEMFGWDSDELIGQPGETVYPSRESYDAMAQVAVPVLGSGGQLDIEWEMRRKDGSTFVCRVIAKAINPANTQQGTIWICEDVTQEKRAADELNRVLREQEAIFTSATAGIVFIKDRRIVRCNRSYEEMYGFGPGELDGTPIRERYAETSDFARADQSYADLAKGLTSRRVVLSRRRDGETFWSRLEGRAVEAGDPDRGAVWIVEDITEQRRAEADLQRLLAEQQLILDNATVGVAFVRRRVYQRCNARLEEMFGYAPGEMAGQSTRIMFPSVTDFEEAGRLVYAKLTGDRPFSSDWLLKRADGSTFWCKVVGKVVDPQAPEDGSIWIFDDINAEHEAREALERALAEQELILANATVGISFVRHRIYQRCNPRLEEIFGYGPGELVGRSTAVIFQSREEWERCGVERYEAFRAGRSFVEERQYRCKDGHLIWCKVVGRALDPNDPDAGIIWIHDDITAEREAREALERAVAERTAELSAANEMLEAEIAERKQAESRAQHLADHDALTGLPNRRLLEDRLTQGLALSYRNRKGTAVMFIDLDRFKTINDSLGHAVGDALLKEVAQRLVAQMREGDTICRIGGDEFVVVLPEIKRSSDAAHVAQKVIENLSQSMLIEGRELTVTPSIGISVFPEDGRDAETLIRNADAAMYHAKDMGRANYQFFTDQMNLAASRRLALETDLRRAVQKGELLVYYQPISELRTGCVAGHEALVRWQHPSRGLVAPTEFIHVAEETGLIVGMGSWVLAEACRWGNFIGVERGLQVSVNLSARQFMEPKLVETVARTLAETGLPGRLLELEITESTTMQNTDITLPTMKKLKDLGVSIAIDDFGTGYSSLAYLKRFPVDKLKVDRSFLADLPRDREHRAIVSAIVAMAHALGIKVVAEGVENEAQLEFLQSCECDYVQGFLVGEPVDADTAAKDYL